MDTFSDTCEQSDCTDSQSRTSDMHLSTQWGSTSNCSINNKTHFILREALNIYCVPHIFSLPLWPDLSSTLFLSTLPSTFLSLFGYSSLPRSSAPVFRCRHPVWRALTLLSCTLASTVRTMSWWFRNLFCLGRALDPCPCRLKMAQVHQRRGSSPLPYPNSPSPPRKHPAVVEDQKGEWTVNDWNQNINLNLVTFL